MPRKCFQGKAVAPMSKSNLGPYSIYNEVGQKLSYFSKFDYAVANIRVYSTYGWNTICNYQINCLLVMSI